jgi:hypothetical protein
MRPSNASGSVESISAAAGMMIICGMLRKVTERRETKCTGQKEGLESFTDNAIDFLGNSPHTGDLTRICSRGPVATSTSREIYI